MPTRVLGERSPSCLAAARSTAATSASSRPRGDAGSLGEKRDATAPTCTGGGGGGGGDGRVVLHVHDSAVTGGGHKGQGEAERARKERHRDAQRDTHNTRGDAKDSSAAAAGRRPLCAGRTWRSRSPYATNTSALTVSSRSLKRPTSGPAAALYTSHTASG